MIAVSSNSNHWLVCPQANPEADVRLFFFPYAGGGPAAFNRWFAGLPKPMQGCAIHYPGRGSRHHEQTIKDISLLVDALSGAIQPLLDRPFVFLGHSLGGLVAFELARHLCQNDLPEPTILFISGCGAPHLPNPHQPIHTLPDVEFIEALQRLNNLPSELLELPEAMESLLPALRADFEAFECYQYTPGKLPLDCPIVTFGGLDDPRVSREQLEGWALHTSSSFKSQYFPGDHFFINTVRQSIIASIATEIEALSPS